MAATSDCMLRCRMGFEDEMRLPDETVEPSAATTLPDDYTITADANGDFCVCESYTPNRYVYTTTAGTIGTLPTATPTNRSTAFLAAARYARMVCMKVQVMYVGAEMASAGYVSMTRKSNLNDVTSMTVAALHSGAERQYRAQEGMTFYVGYRQPPRFEDPTSVNFMIGTFPVLVIVGSGMAAGAVLKVRTIRFMEYQPKEGDLSEGSVMAEPYDPASMAVSAQLSTPMLTAHTGPEKEGYLKRLSAAANAAYHVAQPMLTNYVVPRAKEYLKSAMALGMEAMPLMLTL
jgi:hypothetical protein